MGLAFIVLPLVHKWHALLVGSVSESPWKPHAGNLSAASASSIIHFVGVSCNTARKNVLAMWEKEPTHISIVGRFSGFLAHTHHGIAGIAGLLSRVRGTAFFDTMVTRCRDFAWTPTVRGFLSPKTPPWRSVWWMLVPRPPWFKRGRPISRIK